MPDKEKAHVMLTVDAGEQDFDSERVLDQIAALELANVVVH